MISTTVENIFEGKPYRVIKKSPSWHPRDLYDDYSPNDIFIGLSAGHAYFMVGHYRFDGGMGIYGTPSRIRQREELSPGAILRIKNAPNDIVQKLLSDLQNHHDPISATCSHGVCSFLNDGGLNLNRFLGLVPSTLLTSLLPKGVSTKDGRILQTDLIVFGFRDLDQSIFYSRGAEIAYATIFNPMLVSLAFLATLIYFVVR